MRYGIIGARVRRDRERVVGYVSALPDDAVVISGGAQGPDTWAVEAARGRGLATVVHHPAIRPGMSYLERVEAFYARNRRIAADCDVLVAFVAPDRGRGKGGTEYTIRQVRKLGKPIVIIGEEHDG